MKFIRKVMNLFRRIDFGSKGVGCIISKGKYVSPKKINIGEYVYIGPEPYIHAGGGLKIGDGVSIGPKLTVWTVNHKHQDVSYLPYDPGIIKKEVVIGSGVWIGVNCTIAPGVEIGDGAIIAAGSVLVSDVPAFSIFGGNPAKLIKERFSSDAEKERLENLLKERKWYLKEKP
ncbi:acyltransferase [Alcanivorax sp. MM125-6]|nr:acyltransferase [Alcanivorax sp. MM125-6]